MQRLTQLAQFDHIRFLDKMPLPLEGTFGWVLHHPTYSSWLGRSDISILRVLGKSGCGKSMLSKYLLAHSKSQLDWIASGYFSFSATEGRQNLIQVYSSLLLQILESATSIYPLIIEACSVRPKGDWDEKDWEALLEAALAMFPHRRVILVLDALDECDAFGSDVLEAIIRVCRKAPWCKVLVTSRPIEGKSQGDDVLDLNLDKESGLEGDVKLFVADRVRLLVKALPFVKPMQPEITKRLNERADGMFLLVEHIHRSLVNLKGTSRKNIRQVLDSLPETLEDAYAQTFDRIEPEDRNFAKSVLTCLLYAARPMTVSELTIAVAITEQTPNFWGLTDDLALSVLYEINARIGPIIAVTNGSVSLIHASIKDFLLSTAKHYSKHVAKPSVDESPGARSKEKTIQICRKWYFIDKDEANNYLLSACMKYLDLCFQEWTKGNAASNSASQNSSNDGVHSSTSNECEEFLSYVVESIPDHARDLSPTSIQQRQRVKIFLNSDRFAWWRSCYWTLRDPSRVKDQLDPLGIACLLGLKLTVEDLLTSRPIEEIIYFSAKHIELAIESGSYEIVKLLIDRGAPVDGIIKEGYGRTLLSAAVWYGRIEIIKLLLETPSRLNIMNQESNGYTVIDIAVLASQQATVRWLHAQGASINLATDGTVRRTFSTLQVAARSLRSEMIPMLLELGADMDERSKCGDLAFHLAAESGDVKALQLLKPRDIDVKCANGDTAFLRAVAFLREEAMKYLLREGANVNARNNDGEFGSAVHRALKEKRKPEEKQKVKGVVQHLLNLGFDVPNEEEVLYSFYSAAAEQDNEGVLSFFMNWPGPLSSVLRNPFYLKRLWSCALDKYAFEVCIYLLQTAGIHVNTRDGDGATALHIAAARENVAFCQKLISNYHADIMIRDKSGRSPLHRAIHARSGEEALKIADLLTQRDKQIVNMVDNFEQTALHLAVEGGFLQIAKLLLERGATVDAADKRGRTPLHVCNTSALDLVTLLLEAGANPLRRPQQGGISFAMRAADANSKMTLETIFRMRFCIEETDVLETVQTGGKSEIHVSSLLWYAYVDGNTELARGMLNMGLIQKSDKEAGLRWAVAKREDSVVHLLAPTLDEISVKELFGTELATWLRSYANNVERTSAILFILRSGYANLNEYYSPHPARDSRLLNRGSDFNPLREAARRGELVFVKAMLETKARKPISKYILGDAIRSAQNENHQEVARCLEEFRASQP
jgi:ankyrin repeat protein